MAMMSSRDKAAAKGAQFNAEGRVERTGPDSYVIHGNGPPYANVEEALGIAIEEDLYWEHHPKWCLDTDSEEAS